MEKLFFICFVLIFAIVNSSNLRNLVETGKEPEEGLASTADINGSEVEAPSSAETVNDALTSEARVLQTEHTDEIAVVAEPAAESEEEERELKKKKYGYGGYYPSPGYVVLPYRELGHHHHGYYYGGKGGYSAGHGHKKHSSGYDFIPVTAVVAPLATGKKY